MSNIDALVQALVSESQPVHRLAPPVERASVWLVAAICFVALVVALVGLRPDLQQKLSEPRYVIEQLAAFGTAAFAAYAAFSSVVPSSPRWPLVLPLAPLFVWCGSLGVGCLQDWISPDPSGRPFTLDFHCLPAIIVIGSLPAVLMALMIRRGAPIYPRLAVAYGALAAAAIGDAGLRLFHLKDASLMVLVWQAGSVALLTVLAGCCGPRLHHWRHISSYRPNLPTEG